MNCFPFRDDPSSRKAAIGEKISFCFGFRDALQETNRDSNQTNNDWYALRARLRCVPDPMGPILRASLCACSPNGYAYRAHRDCKQDRPKSPFRSAIAMFQDLRWLLKIGREHGSLRTRGLVAVDVVTQLNNQWNIGASLQILFSDFFQAAMIGK